MIDLQKLIAGDRRTLAKAITLIESTKEEDQIKSQELLNKILNGNKKSFRLGITGSPGVGKSTFIENFGQYLISQNHKVAVLAIDPSSPTSGGSILGDKTRMEKLSNDPSAFIRPTPSSGTLGGVAQKTREAILLCEAAGFDFIIIETVGVGQSEFEVANMVDFFMILMLPNSGDELQGIKKGILELADAIVVNKADGDSENLAIKSQAQFQSALELFRHNPLWKTKVSSCSALTNKNIDQIYTMLKEFQETVGEEYILKNRNKQNKDWFTNLVSELIKFKLNSDKKLAGLKTTLEAEVLSGQKLAVVAASEYVEKALKN